MEYTNYIVFKSLDEARRHQRGEQTGQKVDAPLRSRKKRKSNKPQLSDAERRQAAKEEGHVVEVAKRWNVHPRTIRVWRDLYRDALDTDQ